MKRFLIILILIFTLQTPSHADDIRDFQVEGMGVEDSLLDYFSEEAIKKKANFIYPNKDYYSVTIFFSEFETFKEVQFHLKANDKNYIIKSIDGILEYNNNPEDCYKKMDEIVAETSKIFEDIKIRDAGIYSHQADQSGKSKTKDIYFDFKSGGNMQFACADFSEEFTKEHPIQAKDHLRVAINTREIIEWFINKAYE